MTRAVLVGQTVLVVLLCGAAGILVDGLVEGHWPLMIAVAAATGAVCSVAALRALAEPRAARRSAVILEAAVVVAGGLVAAVVVAGATTSGSVSARSTLQATIDGAIHGWAALATSSVPSAAQPRLLIPVAIAVWGAAALSALLIHHSSATAGPLLPSLALLILAAVAAGGFQNAPVPVGAAFVALGGLLLLLRNWHENSQGSGDLRRANSNEPRRSAGPGPVLAGGGVVVLGVVGAVAIGPQLSVGRDHDPFDPREVLVAPVVDTDVVNPLDFVASTKLNPDRVMFEIDSDGPLTVRLVSMTKFDGIRWTTTGTYERLGLALPEIDGVSGPSQPTRAEFWIEGLDGPWLPSIDEPRTIDGVTALIDPVARSFVVPAGISGANYRIEADVAELDMGVLSAGLPTANDAQARNSMTLPPNFPIELRTMAEEATAGASSPFEEAVLLNDLLARLLTVQPARAGGHSYGHLTQALTESLVVNEEQLATAFVLLARSIGLPARITVGIAPDSIESSGRRTVLAADVSVWPEVRFDDFGWVAFRVDTDEAAGPSVLVGLGEKLNVVSIGGEAGELPTVNRPGPIDAGPEGSEILDEDLAGLDIPSLPLDEGLDATGGWRRWASWLAGAAALILGFGLAAIVLVVGLKRRRTTRRRSITDPRASVVGAWHDVLDRLVEVDELPVEHLTVEQIVEADRATLPLAAMYRPLNRALYDSRPITRSDAEVVWQTRDRFVETINKNTTARCRLRRTLDPRPLRPAGSRPWDRKQGSTP